MTDYPYPANPGQSHFEGCFREVKHHNCAVAEVDRLRADLAWAREVVRLFMALTIRGQKHITARARAREWRDGGT